MAILGSSAAAASARDLEPFCQSGITKAFGAALESGVFAQGTCDCPFL